MTKHDALRKQTMIDYIAATLRSARLSAVGAGDRDRRGPRLDLGRPSPSVGAGA